MKDIIYYSLIVLLISWILIFGSVYETQYYDFIYMYGDELLVILLLVSVTFYILNYDFTIGLLLFLAIFFITNDLPIIHKSLDKEQNRIEQDKKIEEKIRSQTDESNEKESKEGFRNHISQGAVDFIRDTSDMLNMENNMEGLIGSLDVQINKAKMISKF
jgi:predicted membrane protein